MRQGSAGSSARAQVGSAGRTRARVPRHGPDSDDVRGDAKPAPSSRLKRQQLAGGGGGSAGGAAAGSGGGYAASAPPRRAVEPAADTGEDEGMYAPERLVVHNAGLLSALLRA